jgi:hypothetical protein
MTRRSSVQLFASPRLDQFEGSSFKRILVPVEARQGQFVVANLYAARF